MSTLTWKKSMEEKLISEAVMTDLVNAAMAGKTEALKASPNLNTPGKDGNTVLHLAAEANHVGAVKTLLKAGANFNQVCDGRTPLWVAAAAVANLSEVGIGNHEIVGLLLKAGANPNQQCEGSTPLWVAARKGHWGVGQVLLSDNRVNPNQTCGGQSPLQNAASRGHKMFVGLLLKHKDPKVDINHRDSNGETALYKAAEGAHKDAFMALVKAGADVHKATKSGKTPLDAIKDLEAAYGKSDDSKEIRQMLQIQSKLKKISSSFKAHTHSVIIKGRGFHMSKSSDKKHATMIVVGLESMKDPTNKRMRKFLYTMKNKLLKDGKNHDNFMSTYKDALKVIGPNANMKSVLKELGSKGLTKENLESWDGARFTKSHTKALKTLMTRDENPLKAEEAIKEISNTTRKEATQIAKGRATEQDFSSDRELNVQV